MLFFNLFRDDLEAIRFFSYICLSNTYSNPSFHNRQSQSIFPPYPTHNDNNFVPITTHAVAAVLQANRLSNSKPMSVAEQPRKKNSYSLKISAGTGPCRAGWMWVYVWVYIQNIYLNISATSWRHLGDRH